MKVICENRKAYHDYFIEGRLEAGIALLGTEVKALREGKGNLRDSYVIIKNNEVYLLNCHIGPYSHGNIQNHEPLRTRKLLLKRHEIDRLRGRTQERGYTLIPLKIYLNEKNLVKVEIGIAKGKRVFEKREAIKKKEALKEIQKALKR